MSSSKAEQASHFPTTTESSGDLKNLPRKLMSPDIPQSHQDSSRTPSFISTNPEGNESGQIPSLMEEIRALKARILEIEGRNENPRSNSKIEQRPPGLIEDMEKYRRMEKCLYSHRKEWESQDTTKNLDMVPDQDNSRPGEGNGPWKIHWNIVHNPGDYKRPDPFDPLHDCHITGDTNLDQGGMDDFDETIDYGNRRDRLRKAFEWEMDRLYLSEETSIRRRKQAQQAKEKLPSSGFAGTSSGSNRHQAPLVRSVDWNSFKKLGEYQQMSLCAIDILIEEPVIQEDWRISGFQVGFRRRRNHQKDRQALNAIMSAQLPERIRISSDAIPVILNKILEPSAENWIRSGGEPVVFTRPFKSLTYCEQGLRNLQKKLENRIARETIPEDSNTSPNMVDMYNEQEQRQDPSVRVALEPQRPPSERNKADEQVKQLQSDDSSESEISDHEDENGLREHDLDMITKLRQPVQQLAFFLDTLKRKVLHRCEYLNRMEIIRRDGEQAYRVLHVTSANHRMISPWQRWTDPPYNPDGETKEPRPDFRITCIYVDVDGQHIGPVAKTFDIKPFEGEREATSLEVFPLRLYTVRNGLENEDEWNEELTYTEDSWLRQKLIQRGRRFLDVLRERRWFYAGPTLDDYEEVEGEVIVDFEAAFDVRDEDVSQNKKPQVDGLPNLLLDDYEVGEECRASLAWPNIFVLVDQEAMTGDDDELRIWQVVLIQIRDTAIAVSIRGGKNGDSMLQLGHAKLPSGPKYQGEGSQGADSVVLGLTQYSFHCFLVSILGPGR
ncbi:hypothetical protein CkaCkLH20_00834 [Colletotrichum karsti]|uniref:DUF7025 domain-containing protein n=1 Tax=Colletotrichum karsti TaxID=1095194 RepID=A0A9P6IF54_9PEZI|nr:uncharacterized protein CkaCkLH20_00834 [Colletotrichum karsti]KAF9881688.1 hypothetical protein CkaCkLH20_00834 [Colletotrichum karsti]